MKKTKVSDCLLGGTKLRSTRDLNWDYLLMRFQAVIGKNVGMLDAIIELAAWGFPFEEALRDWKISKSHQFISVLSDKPDAEPDGSGVKE